MLKYNYVLLLPTFIANNAPKKYFIQLILSVLRLHSFYCSFFSKLTFIMKLLYTSIHYFTSEDNARNFSIYSSIYLIILFTILHSIYI